MTPWTNTVIERLKEQPNKTATVEEMINWCNPARKGQAETCLNLMRKAGQIVHVGPGLYKLGHPSSWGDRLS